MDSTTPWRRFSSSTDRSSVRLASRNDEHFVAPDGRNEGPEAGDGISAGGSYRALHPSEDEGDTVLRLFETTPVGQRRVLYEMVEGHRWEGGLRHGIFTADDDLWNALDRDQFRRFEEFMGN